MPPPVDTPVAGTGKRILAFATDVAVLTPLLRKLAREVVPQQIGDTVLATALMVLYSFGTALIQPGKRIVGLAVVDTASGQPASTATVLVREVVKHLRITVPIASLPSRNLLLPGVDGVLHLMTRRTVADMLLGTKVVDTNSRPWGATGGARVGRQRRNRALPPAIDPALPPAVDAAHEYAARGPWDRTPSPPSPPPRPRSLQNQTFSVWD
ncbi:hypothetical protein DFJ74DRAFT_458568 [Hyaloraphidium curvatum]|nr:hypothetical protein DFJ74DRAFT_458568 [Hyaloraphidium curvatum]